MAENEFTPFPVLKGSKLVVYETLFTVSRDFESITTKLESLKGDEEVFPEETIKLFRLRAEEIRAGISHLLTSILHRCEAVDWNEFGKASIDLQQRLNPERKQP